jgi:hypothetical protein
MQGEALLLIPGKSTNAIKKHNTPRIGIRNFSSSLIVIKMVRSKVVFVTRFSRVVTPIDIEIYLIYRNYSCPSLSFLLG